MSSTIYAKSISYDRSTKDYKMTLDGLLIGWAATFHDAERILDELAHEWLARDTAAQADAEAERAEEDAPTVAPALAVALGASGLVVTPCQMRGVWVLWVRTGEDDGPLPFDPAHDSPPQILRIEASALDAAYATLCDQHAADKRWLTALERGREYLATEGVVNLTETGALVWLGLDGHGDYTPTVERCQCPAFVTHGVICRHRAAAELLEALRGARARVAPAVANVERAAVAAAITARDARNERHAAFVAPVVAEVARVRAARAETMRAALELWA